MSLDPRAYWIGFTLVKGVGAVRVQALLNHFGDLQTAWQSPAYELAAAGLSGKIIENLVKARQQVDLARMWDDTSQKGIRVLTWEDAEYPARLKEVDQPPPVLYLRGDLLPEDEFAVAIVGTRRLTPYGRQVAEELATYLARNRVTVVSGLARGIDAVAHDCALKAGGRTIAILGSGVDRIYPPENRTLAERIIAGGVVASDYPPGAPPESTNFPPRNRIISALSMAVVVIEAGETSGALITASFAAEQGREVFAVPGNIFSPQSKGANRLIANGAHPLLEMKDVLDVLDLQQVSQQQVARKALPVDATEARLLGVLGVEPVHIDEICAQLNLPIETVSATLAMMELKGMVRQVGGMNYLAARESRASYGDSE